MEYKNLLNDEEKLKTAQIDWVKLNTNYQLLYRLYTNYDLNKKVE